MKYVQVMFVDNCTFVHFPFLINVDGVCLLSFYVTLRKRKIEEQMLAMTWKINYSDVIFAASGSKTVVNGNSLSANVVTL